MKRVDNYLIQARQAKDRFLTYDQQKLVEKFGLEQDEEYLYVKLLGRTYRISKTTGDMEYREEGCWQDGNRYEEVMTILDLVCDSREDRWLTGRWKSHQAFGLQFHRNLLEEQRDPLAERFDRDPEGLRRAMAALGGREIPGGDIGMAVELFDGLEIGVLFWHGDEEFSPRLRFLMDENAMMYFRYETSHFAMGLLRRRLLECMNG